MTDEPAPTSRGNRFVESFLRLRMICGLLGIPLVVIVSVWDRKPAAPPRPVVVAPAPKITMTAADFGPPTPAPAYKDVPRIVVTPESAYEAGLQVPVPRGPIGVERDRTRP
jgi:hypothetical protein